MFVAGPSLGSYTVIGEHVLSRLAKIYADEQKRERKASINAREKVNQYEKQTWTSTTCVTYASCPNPSCTCSTWSGWSTWSTTTCEEQTNVRECANRTVYY